MAAQAALVTELAELRSMTGDRFRLDRTTILDPIADTLPGAVALSDHPVRLPPLSHLTEQIAGTIACSKSFLGASSWGEPPLRRA
jgi:hypothetical protein